MREQGSGAIINVTSVAGRIVAHSMGPYPASKHALEALSEQLAIEVRGQGIQVAIVEPGFLRMPMLDRGLASIRNDEASPYVDLERRIYALFEQGRQAAGDPRGVAETILHAVTTDQPRLRYLVGMDAEIFLDGRRRMSDEEWVDFGRTRTDEEYWAEFMQRFPVPVEA